MWVIRQALWGAMQIAVFVSVAMWASSPEMQQSGGSNPYAVGVFALLMTMAATAAVMISRDLILWAWRAVVYRDFRWTGARLFGPALSKPNETYDRPRRIDAAAGPRKPRELPARRWIGKQPR
jgi:hypothetical protein